MFDDCISVVCGPCEIPDVHNSDETEIYLMRNTRTGFIKIGRSNNPVQRLSQLRLTEPEIELIVRREFLRTGVIRVQE